MKYGAHRLHQSFKEKLFQTNLMCEKLQIKMYKIILGVKCKDHKFGCKIRIRKIPEANSDFFVKNVHHLRDHSDSPLLMNALKTSISLHSIY